MELAWGWVLGASLEEGTVRSGFSLILVTLRLTSRAVKRKKIRPCLPFCEPSVCPKLRYFALCGGEAQPSLQ